MSFISKAWKSIRKVVAPVIGGVVGGPLGSAIGGALAGSSRPPAAATPTYAPPAMPGGSAITFTGASMSGFQPAMAVIPRAAAGLPALGRGLGFAAGAGLAGARNVARSAMAYCRRHPQWCSTIGGLAAVEALVSSGQLPAIKRRRRKGISASDLSKFRRVASILHKWSPMVTGKKPRCR